MLQAAWELAEQKSFLMAALLLPLRLARVPVKKGKTQPLASWLILNALKWGTQDAKAVDTLHEQSKALLDACPLIEVSRGKTRQHQVLCVHACTDPPTIAALICLSCFSIFADNAWSYGSMSTRPKSNAIHTPCLVARCCKKFTAAAFISAPPPPPPSTPAPRREPQKG